MAFNSTFVPFQNPCELLPQISLDIKKQLEIINFSNDEKKDSRIKIKIVSKYQGFSSKFRVKSSFSLKSEYILVILLIILSSAYNLMQNRSEGYLQILKIDGKLCPVIKIEIFCTQQRTNRQALNQCSATYKINSNCQLAACVNYLLSFQIKLTFLLLYGRLTVKVKMNLCNIFY